MKKPSFKDTGLKYALDPHDKPAIHVKPKETLILEVEDATSGQIRKKDDFRNRNKIPHGNPVVGPIYVDGAETGGTLSVSIEEIKPTIGQGTTYFSGFNERYITEVPVFDFMKVSFPRKTKICKIENGMVYFDDVTIPYRPMIGTIGVAPHPEAESTSSSLQPGQHGGNMDLSDISIGSTLFLPVFHKGALLYVGDVHAVQGDGEISGTAIEMPAEVKVKIDLFDEPVNWPRIETEREVMSVATTTAGRSFEDAVRTAYLELIMWMEKKYGINRFDGLMLCSQVGRIRVGNLWAVAAGIEKKYLKAY